MLLNEGNFVMNVARSLEKPSICLSLDDLTMFNTLGGALPEVADEDLLTEGDEISDLDAVT